MMISGSQDCFAASANGVRPGIISTSTMVLKKCSGRTSWCVKQITQRFVLEHHFLMSHGTSQSIYRGKCLFFFFSGAPPKMKDATKNPKNFPTKHFSLTVEVGKWLPSPVSTDVNEKNSFGPRHPRPFVTSQYPTLTGKTSPNRKGPLTWFVVFFLSWNFQTERKHTEGIEWVVETWD